MITKEDIHKEGFWARKDLTLKNLQILDKKGRLEQSQY